MDLDLDLDLGFIPRIGEENYKADSSSITLTARSWSTPESGTATT